MRNVTVHVKWGNGEHQSNARVALWIYQFVASGMTGAEYTNSNGEAYFRLDVDSGAEVSVYVERQERIIRRPIREDYYVTV